MDFIYYISAGTALGFAGSLHCVLMCAPLQAALLPKTKTPTAFLSSGGLYHTGRIAAYTMLGLVFGAAGGAVEYAGIQKIVSILAGGIILVTAIIQFIFARKNTYTINTGKLSDRINYSIKEGINKLIAFGYRKRNLPLLGFLNGLLPCGLVYSALVLAGITGSWHYGAFIMTGFGIGTLPLLTGSKVISEYFRRHKIFRNVKRFAPAVAILLGLFLIFRGTSYFPDYHNHTTGPVQAIMCK